MICPLCDGPTNYPAPRGAKADHYAAVRSGRHELAEPVHRRLRPEYLDKLPWPSRAAWKRRDDR